MSVPDGGERITISRETLRAELAQLELRLVDRLTEALLAKADSAVVAQLEARTANLELSRAGREHLANDYVELERRVVKVERFRLAFPSAAVISTLIAAAVAIYSFVHG